LCSGQAGLWHDDDCPEPHHESPDPVGLVRSGRRRDRPATGHAGAKPAAPAAAQPRKIPGLSDAGNAIYAKYFGTPDPQLLTIARQQRTVHASLVSMAMGSSVNLDKLADLLKQRDTLQAQFRGRQNDLTVTMMHDLSEEDRGIYLRYSLTPSAPK
jgi:hypothetical protein